MPESHPPLDRGSSRSDIGSEWPWRALGWACLIAVVALAIYILGPIGQVLLIAFAGVLFGIFLDGLGRLVRRHTRLGRRLSLLLVVLTLVGLAVGTGITLAPRMVREVGGLAQRLPQAMEALQQAVQGHPWAERLGAYLPSSSQLGAQSQALLGGARSIVGGVLGLLAALVLVLFIGLFAAAEPEAYARGLIRLVPPARRARWREVLGAVRKKLFWWVIGRVVNMTLIGTMSALGLALLGVPLPVGLGVLAGLLTFVPNIGPIVSVIPAALLALTVSPTTVAWVLALYAGLQTVESYVITPLVQRRAVSVPPALLLTAQVVFGVPFGALGLLLATPLVAVAIVLTRMLYVEDRLGDRDDAPDAPDASDASDATEATRRAAPAPRGARPA